MIFPFVSLLRESISKLSQSVDDRLHFLGGRGSGSFEWTFSRWLENAPADLKERLQNGQAVIIGRKYIMKPRRKHLHMLTCLINIDNKE